MVTNDLARNLSWERMRLILLASTLVFSAGLLWLFERLAPALGLLDEPNARSLHDQPVVVGGGVAFALSVTLALYVTPTPTVLDYPVALVGLLLCALGMLDDRFELPSLPRLLAYFLAAVWLVNQVDLLLDWHSTFALIAIAIAVTWHINLFNFMDGADGLAVTQALMVSVGLALISSFSQTLDSAATPHSSLAWGGWIFTAALLPFAVRNWPPARVFMGDSGAVFLGFILAAFGMAAFRQDARLGAAWAILMAPFITDATATLLLRLSRGLPPHVAHSDHLYQRLARRMQSPLPVVLGLMAMHMLWQFPLACWVVMGEYSPWIAVILSPVITLGLLAYERMNP